MENLRKKINGLTRADAQAAANNAWFFGLITRAEWNTIYEELSNPQEWSAAGRRLRKS